VKTNIPLGFQHLHPCDDRPSRSLQAKGHHLVTITSLNAQVNKVYLKIGYTSEMAISRWEMSGLTKWDEWGRKTLFSNKVKT
jgi:hypothetical protein